MKKLLASITLFLFLISVSAQTPPETPRLEPKPTPTPFQPQLTSIPKIGQLEEVAELQFNPGNITVTKENRIFASLHQFRPCPARLVEITSRTSFKPWPDEKWNAKPGSGPDVLNAVLGLQLDSKNRLWVLDNGNSQWTPKLVAFDITTGKMVYRYDFPEKVAPIGTFLNDLAVDNKHGFIYIADIGGKFPPALVSVNLNKRHSWRFEGHASLAPEDVDAVVDGKVMTLPDATGQAKPSRVGVNPITLSADCKTLYYGSMTGKTWWSIPTKRLRKKANFAKLHKAIERVGPKPVSDGATTDSEGNHYFTNIGENAITVLNTNGKLTTLCQDDRLSWPDSIAFGSDCWLYIVANQLHLSPPLHGGVEGGKPPYLILRVWTGKKGIEGRGR